MHVHKHLQLLIAVAISMFTDLQTPMKTFLNVELFIVIIGSYFQIKVD